MEEKKNERKAQKKVGIRDTIYGRIDVPVKRVDQFIIAMLILLVLCIIGAIIF